MTLQAVLHAHIPTLEPGATVRDAVDRMDLYQFPSLVCLDAEDEVVAVLTEGDLARAVIQQEGILQIMNQPAISFASTEPATACPSMEVAEALHLMLSRGITILPICDDALPRALVGVVFRVDLMRAMIADVVTLAE